MNQILKPHNLPPLLSREGVEDKYQKLVETCPFPPSCPVYILPSQPIIHLPLLYRRNRPER